MSRQVKLSLETVFADSGRVCGNAKSAGMNSVHLIMSSFIYIQ